MEQSTAYFEDVAKITVNIASVITQEKKGNVEYYQANTYNKNEVSKSIEEKSSEKIEQTSSETIEQTACKKFNKPRAIKRKSQKTELNIFIKLR